MIDEPPNGSGEPRRPRASGLACRTYAIDPCWLLTGEYDALTHKESLERPDHVVVIIESILQEPH